MPCEGGVPPLKGEALRQHQQQISSAWEVVEEHHLKRTFTFPNFRRALEFVQRVGELAEEEGHHPDLTLSWGRVEITLFTHSIGGLSENDFILAAKIDPLYEEKKG